MTPRTKRTRANGAEGFSIIELMIAMAVTLIIMSSAVTLLVSSLRVRTRENQKSDALADAQRALSTMSRDIANSGFGLTDNGIVIADSNQTRIRVRANISNTNATLTEPDEDVTYVFQADGTILRYDPRSAPTTSALASRITALRLSYINTTVSAAGAVTQSAPQTTPSVNTTRVTIAITVRLDPVAGQPASEVLLTSDVALRNSPYILSRY